MWYVGFPENRLMAVVVGAPVALNQMVNSFAGTRVEFTWSWTRVRTFMPTHHDRHWMEGFTIDRGLDIFQRFESGPSLWNSDSGGAADARR